MLNQENINGVKSSPKSPKKTPRKSKKNHKPPIENSLKNDKIVDNDDDETISPTTKAKRNAFELMMDSRFKVIGRNSPGKDNESNDDDDEEVDDKIVKKSARKLFLENWAESKGASKRKRIEEEIEQCINEKMEKRSKRLKDMLKINDQQNEGEKECDNETANNGLSKQNVKAWRMKIKLCMEENVETNDSTTTATITNSRLVGGRVLREKKLKPNCYKEDAVERPKTTPKKSKSDSLIVDLEDEKQHNGPTTKQSVKIAPVFRRSLPKPKIDPTVLEAKREFLLSGIPTSFKKELAKHPSFEDVKYDVFPTISHVQQKDDHNFWNLPKLDLKLLPEVEEDAVQIDKSTKFPISINNRIDINNKSNERNLVDFEKTTCYKSIVERIKLQNPNQPIYRMFKMLYEQSGYKKIEKNDTIIKKRGRKKKNDVKITEETVEQDEYCKDSLLWTEKYKPKNSQQILGNHHTITSLKNWLITFKNNKKPDNNSESEFDTDDSRDSINTTHNTIILTGPYGCGKTCAIYAICNELDYNIIEINSSMKRTGKRLLHDLQEATQSHQVRRQQQNQQQQDNLNKFLNKQHKKEKQQKICVLLIEDIDIIFEQEDESFYSALNQIASQTKRPIILTTNNYQALIEQKFLLQYQQFRFLSTLTLSSTIIKTNIWLQLICLIENGFYVDLMSIQQLLNKNNGDIRRTLLELQLWVNTGGQINQVEQEFVDIINNYDSSINVRDEDDSNLSTIQSNGNQLVNYKTHYNCINCFETIGELLDLEKIWWNLPNFLNLTDCKSVRLRSLLVNDKNIDDNDGDDDKNEFLNKLNKLSRFYDNLIFTDFYYKSFNNNSSLNCLWQSEIKDSLSLSENLDDFNDLTIGYDLSHYLIFNNLKYCGFTTGRFDAAVPEPIEIKWRSKMRSCDKNFRNALPLMTEHNSIQLDYMPILRNIARTELQRSITNAKRNNRFYNYLRNLGINCNDKTYKLACDIFKI